MPIPIGGTLKTTDVLTTNGPTNTGKNTCGATKHNTLHIGRVNDNTTVIGKRRVGAKKITNGAQTTVTTLTIIGIAPGK